MTGLSPGKEYFSRKELVELLAFLNHLKVKVSTLEGKINENDSRIGETSVC